jgi:hypothetical protein
VLPVVVLSIHTIEIWPKEKFIANGDDNNEFRRHEKFHDFGV